MKLTFNNKRAEHILSLYKSGKTLAEIGDIFEFSRARAQQIIIREMKRETLDRMGIKDISKDDENLLDMTVKEKVKEIASKRTSLRKKDKDLESIERINEKMRTVPSYSVFATLSDYARTLDESPLILRKYFPDIVNLILQKQKKLWSRHYNKCRDCGTSSIKHASHGLCEKCYVKSDIFKEMQSASRVRNIEKWRKAQRIYSKEYSKRPAVVAKKKQKDDQKNYGGNRERAISRDGFACQQCGITREESQLKLKRDLYVNHVGDTNDNRLENLITVCKKCHNKNVMKLMHEITKSKKSMDSMI